MTKWRTWWIEPNAVAWRADVVIQASKTSVEVIEIGALRELEEAMKLQTNLLNGSERERNQLRAENERLRAALKRIASGVDMPAMTAAQALIESSTEHVEVIEFEAVKELLKASDERDQLRAENKSLLDAYARQAEQTIKLKDENERFKGLLKDHEDDWKRIQDAEREVERLRAALERIAGGMIDPLGRGAANIAREALEESTKEDQE